MSMGVMVTDEDNLPWCFISFTYCCLAIVHKCSCWPYHRASFSCYMAFQLPSALLQAFRFPPTIALLSSAYELTLSGDSSSRCWTTKKIGDSKLEFIFLILLQIPCTLHGFLSPDRPRLQFRSLMNHHIGKGQIQRTDPFQKTQSTNEIQEDMAPMYAYMSLELYNYL